MADRRIEELRRRIERDPGSRLFAQLAEELRKEGELEEAIGVARAGLQRHPNYPSARLTLGRALLDSGDPAAARSELDAAVKGAPDNILASRLLGEALETLGDLGGAVLQYRRTLEMAPSDRHVEARIQAIQQRLGAPGGKQDAAAPVEEAPTSPPAPSRDLTAPMKAVKRAAAPPPEGAAPDEREGAEHEGGLPPTIRIRMPGDPVGGPRAPMPPPAARPPVRAEVLPPEGETALPGTPSREETTLPAPTRVADEGRAGTHPGPGGIGETAAGGEEAEPPAPVDEVPPEDEQTPPPESDLAPTLPSSKAAEYAALDESLPPTVPPRGGTAPAAEGPQEPGDTGTDLAGAEPAAPAEPPGLVAEESEVAAPPPPPAPEPPVRTSKPVAPAPPAPPSVGEPPPVVQPAGAEPPGGEAPPAAAPTTASLEPADKTGVPLSSGTLAELYFQQGLLDRAIAVYREVIAGEPGNEAARARLAEIEAEARASVTVSRPGPPAEGDGGAARRRVLERTIERLEALLAIVQRR